MDRKEEYIDFLESGFWKNLSIKKKYSVGKKCEFCRSEDNLNCHHKIYRDNWFETKIEDLIVLCYNCHKSLHKNISIYGEIPIINYKQTCALKSDTVYMLPTPKITKLDILKIKLSVELYANKKDWSIKNKNKSKRRIDRLTKEIFELVRLNKEKGGELTQKKYT